MNILVTGIAGFLGSALMMRLSQGRAENDMHYGLVHDKWGWELDWEELRGDLTNYPRLLEIIVDCEIDQIYHFAAKSIVRNCKSDPLGCFHTNVLGTANLLEAARQSGCVQGIMVMESDKSYGDGPVPYVEDQALQPGSVYEASKACTGHVCRAYYKNYALPVFTVRSANVYGPGDPNMSRLVPRTITRLLRGQRPQVTAGAKDFLREFIYVDDFVDYVTGLMQKQPWGEAINVGSGETATVAGVAEMICVLMKKLMVAEDWPKPDDLVEIPEQVLSLEKLRKWLPEMKPPVKLQEGLRRTIEYYREEEPVCV